MMLGMEQALPLTPALAPLGRGLGAPRAHSRPSRHPNLHTIKPGFKPRRQRILH